MVGYYKRFIHMFATKTRPLTRFLHEDALTPMEVEASKCIVVTYEIRVFFEGAKKEVFSSILKKTL